MNRKISIQFLLYFLLPIGTQAQNYLKLTIQDSLTHEALIGVVIHVVGTNQGAISNLKGEVELKSKLSFPIEINCDYTGYEAKKILIKSADNYRIIFLAPKENKIDEVQVVSTRTNARIEDLPTKVEVLGMEEMDEEATIVPGNIGSILGDLAVITVQRTNPINGNDAVRMQGLDYKYTQILRDGMPMYDGFSGSLGILAIPPLDLKQVEIIKGSSSILYGGGAIGGLINFISRTPDDTPALTAIFNLTSLGETNVDAFCSKKHGKYGMTIFSGYTNKIAKDINNDGFSEVPEQQHAIIHPRFFFKQKNFDIDFGLTINSDNRRSGDMLALQNSGDTAHSFLYNDNSNRITFDQHINWNIDGINSHHIKYSLSSFSRNINYNGFLFNALQNNLYSEYNYLHKGLQNTFVGGITFNAEAMDIGQGSAVFISSFSNETGGVFFQDDYKWKEWFTLQAGARIDRHSRYGTFILPAAGIFLKPNNDLSIRLHYGSGYKTPNLFTNTAISDYRIIQPISSAIYSELSNGYNCDVNYRFSIKEKIMVQINQAFYYTDIQHPTVWIPQSYLNMSLLNAPYNIRSVGSDTYIRMSYDEMELYLGYNHTDALQQYNSGIDWYMPFNPRDKIAATLLLEEEELGRIGLEASYLANQYIGNHLIENTLINEKVPNYWFFAAMAEIYLPKGSLVFNIENIGNYKQSLYMPLMSGTLKNPTFSSVWGPLEGRVFNVCLRVKI